jgi:hypothetical protein
VNPDDVTRAEIYQLMVEIRGMIAFGLRVVYVLAGLIVVQIVFKWWETRRVMTGLDMTARHGAITDAQRARMDKALDENETVLGEVKAVLARIEGQAESVATTAREARSEMQTTMSQVPEETAQRVVDKMKNGGSHHDLPAQGN